MSTVAQIAQEIMYELEGITTDTAYQTLLEYYVNAAYEDILAYARWDFTIGSEESISLVAATQEYSLGTGVGELTSMVIPSIEKYLNYTPTERLIFLGYDREETGEPEAWWISGYDSTTNKYKIKVWPIPSQSYTAKAINFLRPAVLATGTTVPVPDDFRSPLKNRLRFYAYLNDGDAQAAEAFNGEYLRTLDILKGRFMHLPADRRQALIKDVQSAPRTNYGLSNYPRIAY